MLSKAHQTYTLYQGSRRSFIQHLFPALSRNFPQPSTQTQLASGGHHSTAPLNVSGGGSTSSLWPQNQQQKSPPLASPSPSSPLPCPPEGNGGLAAFHGNRKVSTTIRVAGGSGGGGRVPIPARPVVSAQVLNDIFLLRFSCWCVLGSLLVVSAQVFVFVGCDLLVCLVSYCRCRGALLLPGGAGM